MVRGSGQARSLASRPRSSDTGRAPRGLHAVEAGRLSGSQAGAGELGERLPHAISPGAATGGVHDRIGQGPAELLRELEPGGFLPSIRERLAQGGHVQGTGLRGVGAGRCAAGAPM